jgi:hypothetical protein
VYSELGLGALEELDDEMRGVKVADVALVHGDEGLVELLVDGKKSSVQQDDTIVPSARPKLAAVAVS